MPVNFTVSENGDLRFTESTGAVYLISIYEPDLIRVQYWPLGAPHPDMGRTWAIVDHEGNCPPEGFDRQNLSALKRFPRASYSLSTTDEAVLLKMEAINLKIALDSFHLDWFTDTPIAADNPLLGYQTDSRTGTISHTMVRTADEHYYGFGEKSGPLDKSLRRMKMRSADAFGYNAELSDPLYKHIPFYITLRDTPGSTIGETTAYGLFYDTPYDCEFDMGGEIDGYYGAFRTFRAVGGHLDYYFMAGGRIETIVERYTALTGRIPLPPRWSLDYLGSAMRYTDAPNAQVMLGEFIAKCREHDISCGGFHLSSGYSMAADGKRYVFTWNRDRIPDPGGMAYQFHAAGMHLAANIKPGMLTTHPLYEEATTSSLFIREADSDQPDLTQFWGGAGAHLDFTNPATFAWWKAHVTSQLLEYGIDSTWNDNNEFNIRHETARCHGFGHETPIMALKPIQTLLMVMASHTAQREHNPDTRAWVLTRAGSPGIQRYAVTWTGDNQVSWNTLRYNIPMGLGLSLSGCANMGHDVGGFAGNPPDPELFLRWVQNGIFHPRFCIHSERTNDQENAPWMYPEILPQVRDLLRFRARLIPYLYSLLWEASQTGHPVIRPTVYHFQDDPQTHTQSFEFMLGSALLVANVLEPDARQRTVYLPRGTGWYDWYTGAYFDGGQTITLDAPLERSPLLVRAGSIIPTELDGKRQIFVFPPHLTGECAFDLYEDDGESLAFQRGDYRIIHLRAKTDSDSVQVDADADVEWILPSTETRKIIKIQPE